MSKTQDRTGTVDPATELEERAIWNTHDTVFLRETGKADSDIHLYEDCRAFPNEGYDATDKDIAVYPRGFKDVCSWCLQRWRENDGTPD